MLIKSLHFSAGSGHYKMFILPEQPLPISCDGFFIDTHLSQSYTYLIPKLVPVNKRYRGSRVGQRWFAAECLYCEKRFRRVKGYASIAAVIEKIDKLQAARESLPVAA